VLKRIRWQDGWQGAGPLSCRCLQLTVGGQTLEQMCRNIDVVNPPRSLRDAYARLSFPLGGGATLLPRRDLSLREVVARVVGRRTVRVRFLSYNTYLLPGAPIPVGQWIDDAIGWDALAWFGIPWGGALLVALGLSNPANLAIGVLLKALGFKPSKVVKTLTSIDLNAIHIKGKPARDLRTGYAGMVAASYDACCLSEVYLDETRARIIDTLRNHFGQTANSATGPDGSGSWVGLGSGLFFISKPHTIVKEERHVFAERGSRLRDADAWSNKGLLLSVVDLGFGKVEFFQTHFFYGGGFDWTSGPSEGDRWKVWRSTLKELAAFVQRHHDPRNVAIVTGDFNINGANIRHYAAMRQTMDALNLRDAWAWDVFANPPADGYTCRPTDGAESTWKRDFDDVCSRKSDGTDTLQGQYCDDMVRTRARSSATGRFDYVFIERPSPTHTIVVEIGRPRRRPFEMTNQPVLPAHFESERFVSDHIGLGVPLYCTPARR
jgi:hypothetical protein